MKQHFLHVSPVRADSWSFPPPHMSLCLFLLIACGLCTSVILKVTQLMPSVCSSLLVWRVKDEERHCVMVGYRLFITSVISRWSHWCFRCFPGPVHYGCVILHPLQKHQSTFLRDIKMWRYHCYNSAVHLRCLVQAETSPDMPESRAGATLLWPFNTHLHTFIEVFKHTVPVSEVCFWWVEKLCSVGVLWLHC